MKRIRRLRLPKGLDDLKNVHLERLQHLVNENNGRHLRGADERFLFLCYTNRCGSNFLAELLASTGAFNLAGEFFNFDTVLSHADNLKSLSEYFLFLCNQFARNGRLTVKLAVTHLALLHRAGILTPIIDRSKFLIIERNDRLMQAISLAIASQTGQWTSYMPSRISPEELNFDPNQLEAIINNITLQQLFFDRFFAINGISTYTIVYEQLVEEIQLHVSGLGRWLDENIQPIDMEQIRLRPQASSRSTAWRERFLEWSNTGKR